MPWLSVLPVSSLLIEHSLMASLTLGPRRGTPCVIVPRFRRTSNPPITVDEVGTGLSVGAAPTVGWGLRGLTRLRWSARSSAHPEGGDGVGIINRVEHGLAKAVHGAFAKAFKSEVQPVEIASAIRRAMDDRAALLGHGRAMVPNLYTIELSQTDYDRLGDYEDDLSDDLVAAAQEHADSQGYQPGGPLEVELVEGEGLETGVFRVRPATAKQVGREQVPSAARPHAGTGTAID